MKKNLSIILIVLLMSCLFALTACGEEDVIVDKSVYQQLNDCLSANYSGLDVSVAVEQDGLSVLSTYKIEYQGVTTVNYHVEELNGFSVENNKIVVPESYKSVKEGTATYANGKITSIDGDQVDIQLDNITAKNINFSESYFENIEIGEGTLKADVKNIDAFIGTTNSGYTNVKVAVIYSTNKLTSLELSFKTMNESNVNVKYLFK